MDRKFLVVYEPVHRARAPNVGHFWRAMLCKRGLSRHAVSVCPSVTFVGSVKMNKRIFNFFSPPGSHTILVFPHQTAWQYSDGNPPNGDLEGSNAGGVGRNCDSERISAL